MIGTGIVVLSGPPCSGKSTVAQAMASQESTAGHARRHLDVDRIFDEMFPTSDRNRHDRLRAYDAAHALARRFVDEGETVVLTCTYARRDQRAGLARALSGSSSPLWVVELHVPADEAVRRFRARSQDTDLDDALVRERVDHFPYSDAALGISSSAATPDEHARSIAEWLDGDPRPVDPATWSWAGRPAESRKGRPMPYA